MKWQEKAACLDSDPELFFKIPETEGSYAEALKICGRCEVVAECRAAADAKETFSSTHGVWGGVIPDVRTAARRRVLRHRRAAAAVEPSQAETLVLTGGVL